MKLTPIAALLSLTSLPALAIENGIALDWQQHDNLVEMNCTGTIIGGDLVLTADHCKWDSAGGLRPVTLSNGAQIETRTQISSSIPPTDTAYFDIGLWQLASTPTVTAFTPLSLLPANIGEPLTILGFGETQQHLFQAIKNISTIYDTIYVTQDIGQGNLVPGDSGGPTLLNNSLIAINQAVGGDASNHGKLSYKPARDFILNTVNGWHYPTKATVGQNTTVNVQIQSLIQSNDGVGAIDLTTLVNTTGDVTIGNISCVAQELDAMNQLPLATKTDIKPFDVCTLPLTSNGDEGTVTITDPTGNNKDAVIVINKKVVTPPVTDPSTDKNNSNGGGCGSMGLMAIFSLLLAGLLRRNQ